MVYRRFLKPPQMLRMTPPSSIPTAKAISAAEAWAGVPLAKLKCSGLSVDAVVNIKELRKNLPNMAIIGNISTFALAGGNAAVIQNLCNSTIDGGVDVLAPACGLGTTSTVESISIMMKTAIARMEQKEKADA